ncbi:hypothetical protein G3M48_001497 [Beauveria asiatica]|uniref:Uncharacterized protein n=1 Tax=Beauveria asiatica TaxID=1069075 RepID=A0AAW0S088_9HYPO
MSGPKGSSSLVPPATGFHEGSRRQESSEDSAGRRSLFTLPHFSPVPSLTSNFPFTSAIYHRRSSRGFSEDSTAGPTTEPSSSRTRSEIPSSHTTLSSQAPDKTASGAGQIELQVVSAPLQFASDPDNLIPELSELQIADKTVGEPALPPVFKERTSEGRSATDFLETTPN